MTFTVAYRGIDGTMRDERVEAAGRGECFSKCRARGIAPVSVRVGDFTSRRDTVAQRGLGDENGCRSLGPYVLFAASLLLAGGCVWWWFSGKTQPSRKSEVPKMVALPREAVPVPKMAGTNTPPRPAVPKSQHPAAASTTNSSQESLRPQSPPTVTNYMVGITITTNKPRNIFRSATEKMLYSIFSTPLGNPPPPMGRIPLRDKADIETILNARFEQRADTDEKQKEIEQTVDAARKVFKDYMDKGGKPDEFMEFFRDELAKYHEDWKMAQKVAVAACRDEDPEVARQMIDEINSRLAEKGIKPVNIPPKFRERIGLAPTDNDIN